MVMAACVGSLLLGAAGCTAPSTPTPTSNPPTVAPIFASDEEALAAATEAYTNYVETADLIITEGGIDPERIVQYTSGDLAETEMQSYRSLQQQGLHGTGKSAYSNFAVQAFTPDAPDGEGILTAYVCSDVSGTDIVDAEGRSTLAAERHPRTPFLIVFDLNSEGNRLLVSAANVWDGAGVC
ncbi:hypothetical protein [Cryobacterium arcticum]|nr:hypothetical protein [Cryobacterium arcticum]